MIKTISEAAEHLSECLIIDDLPDGDSSPEFRLSFARACHIPILKEKLMLLVAAGKVSARTTAGTSISVSVSPTESTLIEVGEAKTALAADNPFGRIFEVEEEQLLTNNRSIAIASQTGNLGDDRPITTELVESVGVAKISGRATALENKRKDADVLKRHRELNSQYKAPTQILAKELGISNTRVRQIIRRAKKDESTTSKSHLSIASQLKSITDNPRR